MCSEVSSSFFLVWGVFGLLLASCSFDHRQAATTAMAEVATAAYRAGGERLRRESGSFMCVIIVDPGHLSRVVCVVSRLSFLCVVESELSYCKGNRVPRFTCERLVFKSRARLFF